MKSESNFKVLTVCDKCSELLNHKILNPAMTGGKTTEIRVESCPDCLKQAKEIIEGLLSCPDLNFDELDEISIDRIEKAREWLENEAE